MRIGMILDNEFNRDPRVTNEVRTLQEAGHDVFVLCYNLSDLQDEDFNGAKIIRLNAKKSIVKKAKGLNNTIFNFYTWFWKRKIKKFLIQFDIESIHVHDLWMLDASIRANNSLSRKLPLTVDLHENFVYALGHYKYASTFPGNILISQKKWANDEKKWLKHADNVIVVIEEAKERIINLGYPADKIEVVANYVNIVEFSKDNKSLTDRLKNEKKDKFTITYTGGFDIHRGLDVAIRAMSDIIKIIPHAQLVLVGGGKNESDLRHLTKELGLGDAVEFAGYQPHTDLPSYVKASDTCIIPHLKTPHTDNTIPHKLFQYMIMEKVVIASNCIPIERILKETEAGFSYESSDSKACANAIIFAYNLDKEAIGQKGKIAVLNKYNWTKTSRELVKLYSKPDKI